MKKLYLFLIASLLISFAACSPEKKKDVPKKKVNYEEQKIELPPDVIEISCVKELENGNLEMIASTKRKSGLIYERDAKSGKWKENQKIIDELGSGWLMNASSLSSGYFLKYMQDATMEEEYYLMDAQYNLQKIPIQIPEKLQAEDSSFMDAHEVAEGIICGTNDGSGRFYLVDTATGEVLVDYNQRGRRENAQPLILEEKLLIVSVTGVETYEIASGEQVDTDKEIEEFLKEEIDSLFFKNAEDEIYCLNAEKIETYSLKDYKRNILLQNHNVEYNSVERRLWGAMIRKNKNIITYQLKKDNTCSLSELIYLQEGKEIGKAEIEVYMLYEESMPEYIFDKYEETHPDVHFKVERAVGFEGAEPPSVSAIADAVKVLNTRILANDAPDIIVTDHLPISSYIERDVFEDLSEVVDSVTAKEAYFENILNTYKVDDKVHVIPMKFLLPAIYRDESKGEVWVGRRHCSSALKTIYATNFHTCFDEDNSLNRERTKKFLEDAKKLWETSIEDMRGCTEEERMEKYIYYPLLGMPIDSQIAWSNPSVSIGCVYDARTLQELEGAVKGKDAEWKLLNLDGNTYYVPDTSFAISKSSSYKKEAMEFLKYVLTDAEMQKEGFFGGLQIHKDRFREELQEKMYSSKIGTTDEDMVEIPVKQLSDKKCEKLIRDIEKSIPIDTKKNEMMDLVMEVCTKYINDEITLEEAVDEVIGKVSLSMQE